MSEMYRPDLLQRIYDLDEDVSLLYNPNTRFRMIIVGGGALVLRSVLVRATSDIDVLQADKRLLGLMEAYDMNGRVNAYESHFPYNYEDRIEHIWSGKNIDYYTASLEDIVVSKLCSNRPEDLDDAKEVVEHIDWDKLEHLAKDKDELKSSVLNDTTYYNFLSHYEEYKKRFRPCKN